MAKASKTTKKVGPLAASPSHLMHRALQLALDIYSEEMGTDGLTQRQFTVLEAAATKAGLTQTDLVRATGIDRSTLADLVSRMTTKGLLERERSTLDARAMAVKVSAEGLARLEAARPKVEAVDKRIMALLPKGQREVFLMQLAELAAAADAAPDVAKAEAKARKKALKLAEKEAKKAEKSARKSDKSDKSDKPKKTKGKTKPAEPEVTTEAVVIKLVENA